MRAFEPSGIVKSFRTGSGEVTLWFPGGAIAAARVVGHVRSGIAAAAYAEVDRYAAAHVHPGRGFIDLSEMEGFDWESRMILVRWNLAHRKEATRLDLIAWSSAAHLGVRLLSLALGDLVVSHGETRMFDAAYAAAIDPQASAGRATLRPVRQ
jgi:hypothetical protein